jgi:ligand-binding SRPBCC domain-containing protein
LEEGSEVSLSTRPFGIGPRQSWTSRIVDRERDDRSAMFRDAMVDGPFRRWTHTHRFYAEEGGTRVVDRVEYELPVLGGFSGVAWPFFEPLFASRHQRTRRLLEDPEPR